MRSLLTRLENRRDFFRAGARYGLLGLLACLATLATSRRMRPGQQCINRGICPGCAQFENCGLPQALSAKAARRS